MKEYTIPLTPGPTSVHVDVRQIYSSNFGSADIEDEFFSLYNDVSRLLQSIFHCPSSTPAIMSGEGMLALWGALKSVIRQGDVVLSLSSGIFGNGIANMAKQIGGEVTIYEIPFDEAFRDFDAIRNIANKIKPKLITMVHCETPSGVLNPLNPISEIARETGALFYVDFVSSGCGVDIDVEKHNIDLGLLGTQKVISTHPDLSIVFVSPKAWELIEDVKYPGYDALLPWKHAAEKKYFPYTPNWHAIAALEVSLKSLLEEGMENVYKRHEEVAQYCRERLRRIGFKLFPKQDEFSSPTVTAVYVPENFTWKELDSELRKKGVGFGGNWEVLENKLFRIGHMGSQAKMELVVSALDVLQHIIENKSK